MGGQEGHVDLLRVVADAEETCLLWISTLRFAVFLRFILRVSNYNAFVKAILGPPFPVARCVREPEAIDTRVEVHLVLAYDCDKARTSLPFPVSPNVVFMQPCPNRARVETGTSKHPAIFNCRELWRFFANVPDLLRQFKEVCLCSRICTFILPFCFFIG